jgi:hypothetical protein
MTLSILCVDRSISESWCLILELWDNVCFWMMTVEKVSIALSAVYSSLGNLALAIPEKGDGGELPISGQDTEMSNVV